MIVLQKDKASYKIANYTNCGKVPTAENNCYVAAKLPESNIQNSTRWFNVGDGRIYNGYFNQVLEVGSEYTVTLAMEIFIQVTQI